MSATITVLGLSGGCGATTVAALTVRALAADAAAPPAIAAADLGPLAHRLGTLAEAESTSDVLVVDAGRATDELIDTGLQRGRVVLVAAASALGDAALAAALERAESRHGEAALERILPAQSAVLGVPVAAPYRARVHPVIPFDRHLAAAAPLAETRLRPATRFALDRWRAALG